MAFFHIFFILIFLASCHNNNYKNCDLKFIYDQIHENHSGIYNKKDPAFKKNLKYNYAKALKADYISNSTASAHNVIISKTVGNYLGKFKSVDNKLSNIELHMQIINSFIGTFNDIHLRVHWYNDKPKILSSNYTPFRIKHFPEHIVWINLPSFNLTKS